MTTLRCVEVERVDQDRIEIRWELEGEPGPVSIYEGSTPDQIDTDTPVAQTSGESVVLLRPREDGRRYYRVVLRGGSSRIAAERLVPFEQISNFRDLGGYRTSNGSTVRWGEVYRSGELSSASEADLVYLARLGSRVVIDVRSPSIVTDNPDRLPSSGTRLVELAMDDERIGRWVTRMLVGCSLTFASNCLV